MATSASAMPIAMIMLAALGVALGAPTGLFVQPEPIKTLSSAPSSEIAAGQPTYNASTDAFKANVLLCMTRQAGKEQPTVQAFYDSNSTASAEACTAEVRAFYASQGAPAQSPQVASQGQQAKSKVALLGEPCATPEDCGNPLLMGCNSTSNTQLLPYAQVCCTLPGAINANGNPCNRNADCCGLATCSNSICVLPSTSASPTEAAVPMPANQSDPDYLLAPKRTPADQPGPCNAIADGAAVEIPPNQSDPDYLLGSEEITG